MHLMNLDAADLQSIDLSGQQIGDLVCSLHLNTTAAYYLSRDVLRFARLWQNYRSCPD